MHLYGTQVHPATDSIQSLHARRKERALERLCEQASTEQDPVKMLNLITEINELLMAKETRLLKAHPPAERKDP